MTNLPSPAVPPPDRSRTENRSDWTPAATGRSQVRAHCHEGVSAAASFWISSTVSWTCCMEPPRVAPRTSSIFCRMFARYRGSSPASFDICVATPHPARPRTVKTSTTVTRTARPRPIRRWRNVTGGVSDQRNEHREGDGHEDGLRQIQHRDDEHEPGEPDPTPRPIVPTPAVMPSPASQPGHAVAKRVRIEKRSSERRSLECSSESIAPLRSLPERRGDCRVGDRRQHDSSTEVRAVAGSAARGRQLRDEVAFTIATHSTAPRLVFASRTDQCPRSLSGHSRYS